MNAKDRREQLKAALEEAGSGWLLQSWGEDVDNRLDQFLSDLDAFVADYMRRFGERPDPLTLLRQDPYKGKAFLQADTFAASPEMKVMIWRILLGCEILKVDFQYSLGGSMTYSVILRAPYGQEELYHGTARDFRLLRHFGATVAHGRLILQGYYAFK